MLKHTSLNQYQSIYASILKDSINTIKNLKVSIDFQTIPINILESFTFQKLIKFFKKAKRQFWVLDLCLVVLWFNFQGGQMKCKLAIVHSWSIWVFFYYEKWSDWHKTQKYQYQDSPHSPISKLSLTNQY